MPDEVAETAAPETPAEKTEATETKTEAPKSMLEAIQNKLDEKAKAEEVAEAKPAEDIEKPSDVEDAETEQEQATEKAAAVASPSEGINSQLAYRAFQAGMSVEELGEFEDAKTLERAVSLLERRKTDSGKAKPVAKADEVEAGDIPDLDEETVSPEVVKAFNALKGRLQKTEAALQKQAEEREYQVRESEARQFDDGVLKLGMTELFGDKPMPELEDGSEFIKNRIEVYKARQDILARYRERHEKFPSERDLMKRAVAMAFPDKIEQAQRKKLANSISINTKRISAPPTNRKNNASDSPDDEFKRKFKEMLAKKE